MALRIPFIGRTPNTPPYGDSAPTLPSEQLTGHTARSPDPGTIRPRTGAGPYGQSGRANFYGLPQPDELNPKLVGPTGLRLLDEMYRTDAHVRRLILAAWTPLVAGTWMLEPFGGEDATDKDRKIAETIWWLLTEWMTPAFNETLLQLGPLLLRSGFTALEQVGWQTVEAPAFGGQQILAPKKLDIRLPKTIWKWWQDDLGELTYIGQILPNKPDVVIPASELLYFRLGAEGDNWPGTSLLRHAYKHWYIKDRLERIDMVGQERKAVGVPIVYHTQDISPDVLDGVQQAVANMHTSEVSYLMLPGRKMGTQTGPNAAGSHEWFVDVIQFDSSSGEGIRGSIDYHQTAISSSFLTDFLELGHHQVGARATAEVQEDPFITALSGALLPPILPVFNRFVDRLRKLNWDSDGSPTLKLTLHDDASLSEIATYVQTLVGAEAMQVDPDLEDWLRERGGLPTANAQVRAQRDQQQQAEQQAEMAKAKAAADDPQGIKAAAAQASIKQAGQPPAKPAAKPAAKPPAGKTLDQPDPPIAAGLIVQADDTGRVLLIQRTDDKADDDDTRARWEFPGGKLDKGETTKQTALREWQEETGATLPAGAQWHGSFLSPDGKYRGYGVRIPREASLTLKPDPDESADAAWWAPGRLATDHKLRGKVRDALPDIRRLITGAKTLDDSMYLVTDRPSNPAQQQQRHRTVCLDFDGVIHPNTPNYTLVTGPPIPGAVEGVRALSKRYRIVICTAREDLQQVRQWLGANGLGEFAESVTHVKPPAIAYVDDLAVKFTGWDNISLDAAQPPPNLRAATQPDHECATCLMFDPSTSQCWGYGNFSTRPEWTCDSWSLSKMLDSAPLSGGAATDPGLQMIPATGQCACATPRFRNGVCANCDGTQPGPSSAVKLEAAPGSSAEKILPADAADEPTAKWFEKLLSQDRLREAFDGAREHIQAAVGPHAMLAARQLAHQAANGAPMADLTPTHDLINSLTAHYRGLYQLGRETVTMELARQRDAKRDSEGRGRVPHVTRGVISFDAADDATAVGAERLYRARQRGEHSARSIVNKVGEVLGRSQITGLQNPQALQTAAEAAATGALRQEAVMNAAPMISDGRADEALSTSDVIGAYLTSVMDERSCLAPTARVRTCAGMKQARDVTLDDELLTHAGRYVRPGAIVISEIEGELLTIQAGEAALTVTADHPILVATDDGFAWRPAGQLAVGDLVVSDATLEASGEVGSIDLLLGESPDNEATRDQIRSLAAVHVGAELMPVAAIGLDDEITDLEVNDPRTDLGLNASGEAQPLQLAADATLDPGFGTGGPIATLAAVSTSTFHAGPDAKGRAAMRTVDHDSGAPTRLGAVPAAMAGEARAEALPAPSAESGLASRSETALPRAVSEPIGVGPRDGENTVAVGARLGDRLAGALALRRAVDDAPLEPVGEGLAAALAGRRWVSTTLRNPAARSLQSTLTNDSPPLPRGATLTPEAPVGDARATVHTPLVHNCIVCARVDAITAQPYTGNVYDFTIPDDRSFWADGLLVHNCDPCIKSDDGVLLSPEEAVLLGPPNPLCEGGDRCRCMLVWVLSSDPAAVASIS